MDGIFIDEATNRWPNAAFDSEATAEDFYTDIIDYVIVNKAYGRAVINPGGPYFEALMAPYYGNSKVISVVFESPADKWLPSNGDCLSILYDKSQGFFNPGPWCSFVPNWDGVEPLKNVMNSSPGVTAAQSAVMIYDSGNSVSETQQMITHGISENIGWFYVTEKSVWSDTPSQEIMDAQSEMLRSSTGSAGGGKSTTFSSNLHMQCQIHMLVFN